MIAYKDIRVSSILTLVLEGASVACITALAFVILFKHGFHVDTSSSRSAASTCGAWAWPSSPASSPWSASRAPPHSGGEAKNAKRTVPKAVIASLVATGAFMVFMAYVEVGGTSNYGAALDERAAQLPRRRSTG